MWKKFLRSIGVIPKREINSFNNNCDKVIRELICGYTAEEIYEKLSDKEVIIEFKNSSIMSIIKPKGIKLIIKNYDINSLDTKTKNKLPSNLDGWKFIRTTLNADTEI